VQPRRARGRHLILFCMFSVALASCQDAPVAGPAAPSASPLGWFVFPVSCGNCPGLTDVKIDRTVVPFRASMRVGDQTSLRAAATNGCSDYQDELDVVLWLASDPNVIRVEASSPESAIVTALAPGSSRITARRRLPSGLFSEASVGDGSAIGTTGCSALPEVVFAVSG